MDQRSTRGLDEALSKGIMSVLRELYTLNIMSNWKSFLNGLLHYRLTARDSHDDPPSGVF